MSEALAQGHGRAESVPISHPLRPTLLTLGNLSGTGIDTPDKTNATVQSWHLNRFVGSLNISTILAVFHHSRTGAAALLQRLADVRLLEVPDDLVEDVSEDGTFAAMTIEYFRWNGGCGDLFQEHLDSAIPFSGFQPVYTIMQSASHQDRGRRGGKRWRWPERGCCGYAAFKAIRYATNTLGPQKLSQHSTFIVCS